MGSFEFIGESVGSIGVAAGKVDVRRLMFGEGLDGSFPNSVRTYLP